jgi:hypothetical protein
MYAKYPGSCSCGSHISMGDMICYDGATRQALCMSCGKNKAKITTSQKASDKVSNDLKKLLDRVAELKELPFPISEQVFAELSQLEGQLSNTAQRNRGLRAALLKMRVKGTLLAIIARYAGACSQCGAIQSPGEPVAFDTEQRRIICYLCVPAS